MERTVAFADLAGFTALTEAHGDEGAADLAGRFRDLTLGVLGPGDRLVKMVGDAAMLAAPDPLAGVELIGRLCAAADSEAAFPILRAGLNHGPVVERDGDLFGAAVNLASRVTAQAAGAQVLATESVAGPVAEAGGEVRALGAVRLRNIADPVALFEIAPCPLPDERAVDPVCRMALDRRTAPGRLTYGGQDRVFCSLACAGAFGADPGRYLPEGGPMKLNAIEKALMNNPARSALQRRYEASLFELLGGRVEGGRALELGCGRGVGAEVILGRFRVASVDAFDLDPDMVERARRRLAPCAGRVRLWVGDATTIPAPDGAYDAVFDFGIVHHIPTWRDALDEVARVLRPGGRFFFEEVTRHALERWSYRTFLDHPADDRFSGAELVAACEQARLVVGDRWVERVFGDFVFGVATRPDA